MNHDSTSSRNMNERSDECAGLLAIHVCSRKTHTCYMQASHMASNNNQGTSGGKYVQAGCKHLSASMNYAMLYARDIYHKYEACAIISEHPRCRSPYVQHSRVHWTCGCSRLAAKVNSVAPISSLPIDDCYC